MNTLIDRPSGTRALFGSRLVEAAASPAWTFVLLAAAAAFVAHRVTQGPVLNPWLLWAVAVAALANTSLRVLHRLVHAGGIPRYPRRSLAGLRRGRSIEADPGEAMSLLGGRGYVFTRLGDGYYGERSDRGFWGALLADVGFAVVLVTGLMNFSYQFRGDLIMAYNQTKVLSDPTSYDSFTVGLLRDYRNLPYEVNVRKFIYPREEFPRGAAEVAVLDREERVVVEGMLRPGAHFEAGGFRFDMKGFIYHVIFSVWDREGPVAGGIRQFYPVRTEDGVEYEYGFHNEEKGVKGRMRFRPEVREFAITLWRGEQVAYSGPMGRNDPDDEFETGVSGYTRLVSLRVGWMRWVWPLYAFGALLLAGTVFRLAVRPRRVWIRQDGEAAKVVSTDRKVYGMFHG
jgi:hypothetical protein